MMKSRGAAVIGAFVLIALAIFVRGLLVGDGATGGSDGKHGDKDRAPVVACTPDLVEVCRALAADGKIAKDPPTLDLDEASAPPDEVDGWITWNPSPQIANYAAEPSPAVWEDAHPLGSAAAAVLVDGSAKAEVVRACGSSPTWECIAGLAPDHSIGVGEPTTAEGIARLAPLARSLAAELDLDSLDVTALDDVLESPASGQVDAATGATGMATRAGYLSIATGPAALLRHQAATAGGVDRGLSVLTPTLKASLTASLTAVLAPRVGRTDELGALDCEDLSDAVTRALGTAGLTPCEGKADDELAGFLYQVQKKVG